MIKNTVTLPDGTTHTRKSRTTYTHAVAVQVARRHYSLHDGEAAPAGFVLDNPRYSSTYGTVPCEPTWAIASMHTTAALAIKARDQQRRDDGRRPTPCFSDVAVFAVTVEATKTRLRVRCDGLTLLTLDWNDGIPYSRTMQCRKDAVNGTTRCAAHADTDNAAVQAEALRLYAVAQVERQRRWNEQHAAEYTAATCPVVAGRCSVHHG